MDSVSCIILAGGKSSRITKGMTSKAFVELSGKPLIAYAIDVVKNFFSDVIIVVKNKMQKKEMEKVLRSLHAASTSIFVVSDNSSLCSPIVGIKAGLANTAAAHVFVLACDMPFLESVTVFALLNKIKPSLDCVAYKMSGKGYEPLCAIYNRQVIEDCDEEASLQKIIDEISDEKKVTMPVFEKKQFFNINTKGDLLKAEEELNQRIKKIE